MSSNPNIFRTEINNVLPEKGKILIAEPFLCDMNFARSVVLLIEHGKKGSMGIVLNKLSKLLVNDIVKEFRFLADIPLHKGGPIGMDTLFFLHVFSDIEGALPISEGIYLNGDFNAIKHYILQGNPIDGKIRFFLGYSGWDSEQLQQEINENTWIISSADKSNLMNNTVEDLWKKYLERLGERYEKWTHFPKIPSLN